MLSQSHSHTLDSAEATAGFAKTLGRYLRPGDVLLLSGEVGAGKSHFARSLILSLLDVPEDIPSPTFTLVQTYETQSGEIWHADLYRLSDTQEIEELGLVEAFDTSICLIEWPDRLGPLAPESALWVDFSPGLDEDSRQLTLRWATPHWQDRLKGWL